MFAYRHHFHAGNFADVFKHALLSQLILSLQKKERPIVYVDTHAGIGHYDLTHPWAIKNKEFIDKAIKTKIDETASREGYISPEEDTVDFVLMYIPLENLYHFLLTSEIGANRVTVIQYAFSKKVILVSPQTLMAYLETIRQSMKLFSLQTDTKNILIAHEKVKSEVGKFIDSFDEVTKRLDQTVESFEKLKTTRKNKLEKSFEELNEINNNSD